MTTCNKKAADALEFIDVLRAVWGIVEETAPRDYAEPGSFSTDIYSRGRKSEAAYTSRRRTEWPY